jgi:hypothetical protein
MKSWKLVLIALIGAFTLSSSSACTVTSDDDDNIGDDDDFGDDDDDGDSGTGGFSGTGGTGGISGTGGTGGISGTGGTGGTGGVVTGPSGGTVADDLVALFAEQAAADTCRICVETNCGPEIDGCGVEANTLCVSSMNCIYDDLTAQGDDANIDCAFSACSSEYVTETAMNEFAVCISNSCVDECGVDVTQAPVCQLSWWHSVALLKSSPAR